MTSLVLSVFDYCNSLLCHSPISTLKPLIALQRYAVRIISYDIPYRADNNNISITSLMCDLHWLPVKKRIVYKLCTLMHAAIHYGTPDYLCLLISIIQQHRSIRSCHIFRVKAIEVPAYSNTGLFVKYGVNAWNELPDILRCTTSRTEFKR